MSALLPFLTAALLSGAPASSGASAPVAVSAPADTVVRARAGDQLRIENFRGTVSVKGGEGGEIRIQGSSGSLAGIRVERSGNRVEIRSSRSREGGSSVDELEIRVPSGVPVEVSGSRERTDVRARGLRASLRVSLRDGSVDVEDVEGSVDVSTVDGSIRLSGVRGPVRAESVAGELRAEDVSGRVSLHSVDDDVTVRGASGTLDVESVDGDVLLHDIHVDRLRASTVDGDVRLEGALVADGRYQLASHDGDVVVTLAEPVNAEVRVSTFDGDFTTDFSATLQGTVGGGAGRRMGFTIGKGGATLVLETFDGDVVLRRAPQ